MNYVEECPICLAHFENQVICKPCGHGFCKKCIDKHFNFCVTFFTCPMCRQKVQGISATHVTWWCGVWRRKLSSSSKSDNLSIRLRKHQNGMFVVTRSSDSTIIRPGRVLLSVNGIRCHNEEKIMNLIDLCCQENTKINIKQTTIPCTSFWSYRKSCIAVRDTTA